MTVWCDPPRTGRPATRWSALISPALERPGQWALVRDDYFGSSGAYQAAKELRAGSYAPDRPAGVWEFRAGRIQRGVDRWGVWARVDEAVQ